MGSQLWRVSGCGMESGVGRMESGVDRTESDVDKKAR